MRGAAEATRVPVVVAMVFVAVVAGCGLGTYDDSGGAEPGTWWPWVCPDGGVPRADAGCLPAPSLDGGVSSSTCRDGSAHGAADGECP